MPPIIEHGRWYETIAMADGVTLVHEPWIKPFFRCNIWPVRVRDRDLLFDSGLGHVSLVRHVALVSEHKLVCVASHTHFDHIGCHHEFPERCVHRAEAPILADPRNEWTVADRYATDDMFDGMPEGLGCLEIRHPTRPSRPHPRAWRRHRSRDRAFEVIHTPGHSPGGIALHERKTGILLSGDIVYDGPLIDDAYHSVVEDYLATLESMRSLAVSIIHGGHFPSFGPTHYRQLIDEYLASKRQPGCHLRG